MAEWDDDNFEPELLTGGDVSAGATVLANQWEGEDEEDEVKDNWEDEEEEKKLEETIDLKPKPKKIPLPDRKAERERLKREEYERQQLEEELDVSPEEQLKRQQESDLKIALETTFGVNSKEYIQLSSKEELQELSETLTKNIQIYSKSDEYPFFVENIIRGVCTTLTSLDLKKIKTTIDNLYLEKQKIEKGDKSKKTKGRSRAKLRMEGDNANLYSSYVDDYDEFNDFM